MAAPLADLHAPGTVLLDTVRPDAENARSLLFSSPQRLLCARTPSEVPGVLAELDEAVGQGMYAAGFLAYEAGEAFEPVGAGLPSGEPLAWFGLYEAPRVLSGEAVVALLAAAGACRVREARFNIPRGRYRDRLAAVRSHIREGDVYQINFTDRVLFRYEGEAAALYAGLRARQGVAYGGVLQTGGETILSVSPELFFRREGERIITRPMKGTVRRGRDRQEDDGLAAWLADDPKSRAENLMIVDLLRNDLSVVCRPGSVRVPALFTVERYETLLQMTSTVEGVLTDGAAYADIFRALFPCGSVTGAPKIRARRIIADLEPTPRGVYCGAVGYVAPGGEAVFNVAIRTAVLRGGLGVLGTGSGVVWDSDADAEYDECLLKARFLTGAPPAAAPAFRLLESMRWEDGLPLLEAHLDRLAASSSVLGFRFAREAVRQRVEEAAAALPAGQAHKLRLALGADGVAEVTATPLPEEAEGPWRVGFWDERVDSRDVFLRHKTTCRVAYERAYAAARAQGLDEALLCNERGEVTEGTRTNVFIRRGAAWYTPPLSCGLLGGVYRRHLLERLPAEERVLRPSDVLGADEVMLCNAVRGRLAATIVHPPVTHLAVDASCPT